jgi:protein-tyrosine phosphatase
MVDIHCHVLPDVDDGPKRIEDSLVMLRNASKAGVEIVVATPHRFWGPFNVEVDVRDQLVDDLQNAATKNNIDIQIKPGYECYLIPEIYEKDDRLVELTINKNGRYILTELPMRDIPFYAQTVILALKDRGITPVIAHPERNTAISKNPNILLDYLRKGCISQLNAGSILGYYGRTIQETARILLQHNLVHLVASDMHSITSSPMSKAFPVVGTLVGLEKASDMFDAIPRRIVMGEDFGKDEPLPYVPKRKSLMDILFRRKGELKVTDNREQD